MDHHSPVAGDAVGSVAADMFDAESHGARVLRVDPVRLRATDTIHARGGQQQIVHGLSPRRTRLAAARPEPNGTSGAKHGLARARRCRTRTAVSVGVGRTRPAAWFAHRARGPPRRGPLRSRAWLRTCPDFACCATRPPRVIGVVSGSVLPLGHIPQDPRDNPHCTGARENALPTYPFTGSETVLLTSAGIQYSPVGSQYTEIRVS